MCCLAFVVCWLLDIARWSLPVAGWLFCCFLFLLMSVGASLVFWLSLPGVADGCMSSCVDC